MAFGTVVHHFAVGVVGIGTSRTVGPVGTVGPITTVDSVGGSVGRGPAHFGPHFLVVGLDGSRAGHFAQAPMKTLVGGGHVIQWVVLC